VVRKTLKASEIIDLIEDPTINFVQFRLRKEAPVKELVQALQTTINPQVQYVTAYVLGKRQARSAIRAIAHLLDNESPKIRDVAADAFANIGHKVDADIGERLLTKFLDPNEELYFRRTLSSVLGAVGYQPAIPFLIEALRHDDLSIRGGAAWSLGNLQAIEVLEPLKEALAKETSPYPSERMRIALDQIASVKNNTKADERE
jgi:HEAT repeat protein